MVGLSLRRVNHGGCRAEFQKSAKKFRDPIVVPPLSRAVVPVFKSSANRTNQEKGESLCQ